MSQYGNKKYANTHKPSDFDSSEPVRYNQSRTGSTQTMTVCKNQATVRLHQAREAPHMTLTSDFRRRKVARRKGNPMKNLTKGIAAVGALAMLTGVGACGSNTADDKGQVYFLNNKPEVVTDCPTGYESEITIQSDLGASASSSNL